MDSVDAAIDLAVTRAEADVSGVAWLAAHGRKVYVLRRSNTRNQQPKWTPEEKEFLRNNIHLMTKEEIGRTLGRTENSIKIKMVRFQFAAPSKREGFLTGNMAAHTLGVDIHSIMKMCERGILPFTQLPGPRHIIQISELRLTMWAINPEHWIYFKTANMQDLHLRRLVTLAQSRWNDEWLRIGQAAAELGVDDRCLNIRIHKGSLPAKDWGNWWIKRSDLKGIDIPSGKGCPGVSKKKFTLAADAFIIKCANAGIPFRVTGKLMKADPKRVQNRWYLWLKPGARYAVEVKK